MPQSQGLGGRRARKRRKEGGNSRERMERNWIEKNRWARLDTVHVVSNRCCARNSLRNDHPTQQKSSVKPPRAKEKRRFPECSVVASRLDSMYLRNGLEATLILCEDKTRGEGAFGWVVRENGFRGPRGLRWTSPQKVRQGGLREALTWYDYDSLCINYRCREHLGPFHNQKSTLRFSLQQEKTLTPKS